MIGELNMVPGLELGRRSGGSATAANRPHVAALAAGSDGRAQAHQAEALHLEAQRLKALLTDPHKRVDMRRDDASGHLVMRIEERATGEMVEQIPSEELVRLYTALRETLIDERA